jgi:segregation and condensation protein A
MNTTTEELNLEFDADAVGEDAFRVQLSDYDGPLDLLLEMARGQKLDLAKISVLALADQYITYIENAKSLRLEIAADYLVMAAWLTYLKSRLLLPKQEQPKNEPTAAQMADALAFQLRRLQSMKNAAVALFALPQRGQGFFTRGEPEGFITLTDKIFNDTLYDLLSAYSDHTTRLEQHDAYRPATPHVLITLEEAIERIGVMFGAQGLWRSKAWISLAELLPREEGVDMHTITGRSYLAALFSASLEMAKSGQIDLQQQQNFGPMYLRAHVSENVSEETHHESAAAN